MGFFDDVRGSLDGFGQEVVGPALENTAKSFDGEVGIARARHGAANDAQLGRYNSEAAGHSGYALGNYRGLQDGGGAQELVLRGAIALASIIAVLLVLGLVAALFLPQIIITLILIKLLVFLATPGGPVPSHN
ncbi:hypothetical protein K491DRAFT_783997 [Lophiostoma macrostomum CBS 122681]|uniref:Uncharacterized protein n=1 Tax=Lophiostoma macrostomum CBS 122681 TaxID=1314788 RepID=A0A6A6SQ79_9PLEO|nr:hypothetical protein K491DRAFT_783997 [Lophiostoma macrostomum CBS 122681]